MLLFFFFFFCHSFDPSICDVLYVIHSPSLNDAERMDRLWQSSESISDMDLVSSLIRGSDPHWELLPSQAMLAVKAGHSVQGFQAFPSFPEVSNSTQIRWFLLLLLLLLLLIVFFFYLFLSFSGWENIVPLQRCKDLPKSWYFIPPFPLIR